MSTIDISIQKPKPTTTRPALWLMGAAGAAAVFAPSLVHPLLALATVLAISLALAAIAWPNLCTLFVLFALYANLAVVAVRFHNVPYVIGAALPLILLVPLGHLIFIQRRMLVVDRIVPLILVFLAIQMMGVLVSVQPDFSLGIVLTSVVEGLGLYFLVINIIRTPRMLRRAIWALMLAGTLMGGLSAYQQISGAFHTDFGGLAQLSEGGFRVADDGQSIEVRQRKLAGPIGEQNRYAQIMLMLLPLGYFLAKSEAVRSRRLLVQGATLLTAAGFVLTFSRGGFVGAVLTVLAAATLGYLRPRHLVAVGVGGLLVLMAVPQYRTRLASMASVTSLISEAGPTAANEPDGSIRGRITEMTAATLVFRDHPLLGVGPGMFKFYSAEYSKDIGIRELEGTRQAHSLYPAIAAEHGVFGLACFLAVPIAAMYRLVGRRRALAHFCKESDAAFLRHIAAGFVLAIVAYMATGIFLHFSYVRYFWLVLALAGAVVLTADRYLREAAIKHTPETAR